MKMAGNRVLVVDDEDTIRFVLQGILEEKGCEVRDAGSAEEALTLMMFLPMLVWQRWISISVPPLLLMMTPEISSILVSSITAVVM